MNIPSKKTRCILAMLLLALVAQIGCDSSGTSSEPEDEYYHNMFGIFVKNQQADSTQVLAQFFRNDEWLTDAELTFSGQPMLFSFCTYCPDTLYVRLDTSAAEYDAGEHRLSLEDSTIFTDTVTVAVPDTFSLMEVIDPATRLNNGGNQVSLDWSGVAGAEGYIMATVPRGHAYTGTGYSLYAASGATGGTIPRLAFWMSGGNEPDTGWYDIYVYAYTGAPDSALSHKVLPVPLPEQRPDNIDSQYFNGRIGSLCVSRRDSVHVVLLP